MDLYDLKPEAPSEYRGIWRPIGTNVPGVEISELFPRQARVADQFSIVRSLHHGAGDHFTGGHIMLTGCGGTSGADKAGKYPSIGKVFRRETPRSALLAHVVPNEVSQPVEGTALGALDIGANP